MTTKTSELPIRKDLIAGIDVGGTKVHIADTVSTTIRRYNTPDYDSLDAILADYFQTMGARPAKLAVGMAGPRDDETGEIKLTNTHWPAFSPQQAAEAYGIEFTTANDMVATTAGVLQETGVELVQLKPGTATGTGTKLVISLSTGIGVAAAVWDTRSKRYVILGGEGGHIGFQPKNEEEQKYLNYLHAKYPHASAELALSGKHGIDNLVDHALPKLKEDELAIAISSAREEGRPVGAVLLAYATEGQGLDQQTAQTILERMGAMVGSVVRDLAVTYKATGGIYLTGSVALALGEYLAERTELKERFVRKGAVHDSWLGDVPISLVADPNVAVVGALALAKDL
ncbi:MAG TPA: glucokinase [Candidatus Saccharimonadales bacterium]|nr:glucokinase [Candidatus Saccharimonadales bacterium]